MGSIFINHKINRRGLKHQQQISNVMSKLGTSYKQHVYQEVCVKTIFLCHIFVFLVHKCKVSVRGGKYMIWVPLHLRPKHTAGITNLSEHPAYWDPVSSDSAVTINSLIDM